MNKFVCGRDCSTEFATELKRGHLKKMINCDLIKLILRHYHLSAHELIILPKFYNDTVKIVDFLLMTNLEPSCKFGGTVSKMLCGQGMIHINTFSICFSYGVMTLV